MGSGGNSSGTSPEQIRLFNPVGELVDSYSWYGGHLTTDDDCTYNRLTDGGPWGEQRCEGEVTYPTPGSSNNIEEPQPEYVLGDVDQNEMINVVDVVLVVSHILDYGQLNEFQQILADVDQSGAIDITDIVLIVQQIINISPEQQSAIINDARKLVSNRKKIR